MRHQEEWFKIIYNPIGITLISSNSTKYQSKTSCICQSEKVIIDSSTFYAVLNVQKDLLLRKKKNKPESKY